jgi:hypothetical protein
VYGWIISYSGKRCTCDLECGVWDRRLHFWLTLQANLRGVNAALPHAALQGASCSMAAQEAWNDRDVIDVLDLLDEIDHSLQTLAWQIER